MLDPVDERQRHLVEHLLNAISEAGVQAVKDVQRHVPLLHGVQRRGGHDSQHHGARLHRVDAVDERVLHT